MDKLRLKYLRLSLEDDEVADGTEAESLSIGSQRLCIQQYIEAHPDLGRYGDFEELIDDGYSGTNFDRPGIKRLLELVEAGRVETIIVRDLSRFARNYLEAGHFLEFVFPAYEVRFISINDHYDSQELGESTAGFQLAVHNLINQLYSQDISRKIKSAVDMKKLNGEYAYGAIPYGYRKGERKNTIVVDPEAASVVKQIFAWAADGVTVTQIAVKLNSANVKTPSEYLKDIRGKYPTRPYWTFDSVKNILVNRIYTGDTVPFKSHVVAVGSKRVKQIPEEEQLVMPDTHEAIISRETYFQSRKVIKSNVKSKSQGPGSLFSTYLVCGCCGNKLHKGKRSNQNFRCPTARYVSGTACADVHIKEEQLSGVLLRAIQNQCAIADAKIQAAKAIQKGCLSEQAAVQKELRAQRVIIEKVQADTIRDYEAYVSGGLSREGFLQRKADRKQTAEDARLQAALLEKRLNEMKDEARSAETVIQAAEPMRRYVQVKELTPSLLKGFVQKITVYPGNMVNIEWNFSDTLAQISDRSARSSKGSPYRRAGASRLTSEL